VCHTQGLW